MSGHSASSIDQYAYANWEGASTACCVCGGGAARQPTRALPAVAPVPAPSGLTILAGVANTYSFTEALGDGTLQIGDGGGDMYDGGNNIRVNGHDLQYSRYMRRFGNVQYQAFADAEGSSPRGFFAAFQGIDGSAVLTKTETWGNNGADGSGGVATGCVPTGDQNANGCSSSSSGYCSSWKQIYSAGDPSINHIWIAPCDWSHSVSSNTDNDNDEIYGSATDKPVYYVMWAGNAGHYYNENDFRGVADRMFAAGKQHMLQ